MDKPKRRSQTKRTLARRNERRRNVKEKVEAGQLSTSPEVLAEQDNQTIATNLATVNRVESRIAKRRLIENINKNIDRLFIAQLNLALGENHLLRTVVSTVKGKRVRHTTIVTDVQEIIKYLNDPEGYAVENEGIYYHLTTGEPDNKAIDSLLNRSLGLPKQDIKLTDEDGIFTKERLKIEIVQPNRNEPIEGEVVDQTKEERTRQGELTMAEIDAMTETHTLETPPNSVVIDKPIEEVINPNLPRGIKITRL